MNPPWLWMKDDESIISDNELVNGGYLVVHPTNRKWVTTLVINGIGGVSPLITVVISYNPLTKWDEPPSIMVYKPTYIWGCPSCRKQWKPWNHLFLWIQALSEKAQKTP